MGRVKNKERITRKGRKSWMKRRKTTKRKRIQGRKIGRLGGKEETEGR